MLGRTLLRASLGVALFAAGVGFGSGLLGMFGLMLFAPAVAGGLMYLMTGHDRRRRAFVLSPRTLLGVVASLTVCMVLYAGLGALFGDDVAPGLLEGLGLGIVVNAVIMLMPAGGTGPAPPPQAS